MSPFSLLYTVSVKKEQERLNKSILLSNRPAGRDIQLTMSSLTPGVWLLAAGVNLILMWNLDLDSFAQV